MLSSLMNSGDYIQHDCRLSMATTLSFYLILSLELVDVALAVLEAPAGPVAVPMAVRVEVVIKEEMATVPYTTLEERFSSIYFDVILWCTRRRDGRGIREKTNQVALAAVWFVIPYNDLIRSPSFSCKLSSNRSDTSKQVAW